MNRDHDRLFDLARRAADCEATDWEQEEARGSDEKERRIIRGLRTLSDISQFHAGWGAPPPLAPGDTWSDFEVIEAIASGSFGAVYRAHDRSLDREVALKIAHRAGDDVHESYVREAKALARVRHANVVVVHGADRFDGRDGLWMEYVEGRTLEDIVRTDGPMSGPEAARIARDVLRALAAVHQAGLVHHDVKARNVMRESGGRIVLMDFGLGRAPGTVRDNEATIGTPLYMAPEQLDGAPPAPAADLYAVGVLLYYMMTREHPVTGESVREIRQAHRRGALGSLRDERPDLDPRIVSVVERALAKDPADRYGSAGEMARALAETDDEDGIASGDPVVTSQAADPQERRRERSSRRPLLYVLVSAFCLLTVFGILQLRAAGGAYSLEAQLYRERDGREERVGSGAVVSPGDELYLEVRTTEDLYVYVLNEDENGESYVLFPLPGYDLANPIRAGESHRLPGNRSERAVNWQVTSAGGREHFILITSPRPVSDVEAAIADLPASEFGREVEFAPLPREAGRRLRGIGGAVEAHPGTAVPVRDGKDGSAGEAGSGPVAGLVDRLSLRAEGIRGVWYREIVLESAP
ncbi:MAG: protein kinase [Gemmatimonadetes bacterium]|nr:protein kinase [Gemmatimonadota bacterium]